MTKTAAGLIKIYNLMYEKKGPMKWWPSETPFETVIGALLAQFVAWKNVSTAIEKLKDNDLLTPEGIITAEEEKIKELIYSTRFYAQKVKKLKSFCNWLIDKYNGRLDKMFDKGLKELRAELLSLYGVGEETADSIILYAAYKPIFVVDTYTRRIFSRLGYFKPDISYHEMQEFFMKHLKPDVELYNDYHAQIVNIGSIYCSSQKPDCLKCPLDTVCKKVY